jgi:hypothetical protein
MDRSHRPKGLFNNLDKEYRVIPGGKATHPFSSTKVEYASNNTSAPRCVFLEFYRADDIYIPLQ